MIPAAMQPGGLAARRRNSKITFRETNQGVAFSERARDAQLDARLEATLRALGLLVMVGGGALSLGAVQMGHSLLVSLGFAVAFAFVGFSIHRHARSGMRSELRLDTRNGKVRLGNVNARGDFTEKRVFRKQDMESFFIQRSKTPGKSRLYVRLKRNAQRVAMLEAPESELVPVLERLFEALFGEQRKPGGRVRTRVNGNMILADFG